jgi:hypothetical protein
MVPHGDDGAPGLSVAELLIFRRASSAPTTPTGGSYNFDTQTLTPPTDWSASIPDGTDPVYVSVGAAAVVGQTGIDSSITWSGPVKSFQDGIDGSDGQAVDMVFKRSATQPSTPSPSSGVPATWYTDVNSVPAGDDPLWGCVGTRPDPASNWTWQTPIKMEGDDAVVGDVSEQNAGSATTATFTLTGHVSEGNAITVAISGTLSGTTTSSAGTATWAYRLQRRINGGSYTTLKTWSGTELSNTSATGPFVWLRETEFNPDVFGIETDGALVFVDTPGAGTIDYSVQWTTTPGGFASGSYLHKINTTEILL